MSSKTIPFTKMHGAGNDYVVVDALRDAVPSELPAFSRLVGDRLFGVGCDQILVVREASGGGDFRMDIFNPDGSQAEMCANGIRAFYKYLRDHGHTDAEQVGVETLAGIVRPSWAGQDLVTVDMAMPVLAPAKIPTTLGEGEGPLLDVMLDVPADLSLDGSGRVKLSSASMGNPHAVIEVDDVETAPVHALGAHVEHHPAFPNRVNVEFIKVLDRGRIQQRTWERGTGETLACGSGACAVAVTSMLRGVVDREVEVELRGGTLQIGWADDDAHGFMTGTAAEVYTGQFPIPDEIA